MTDDQNSPAFTRWFWRKETGRPFPRHIGFHHIDGDPTNNDLSNLRVVDIRENARAENNIPTSRRVFQAGVKGAAKEKLK